MDTMLLQFLDFTYNKILVDTEVFDEIKSYIEYCYGDDVLPGGFLPGGFADVYLTWYKRNVE